MECWVRLSTLVAYFLLKITAFLTSDSWSSSTDFNGAFMSHWLLFCFFWCPNLCKLSLSERSAGYHDSVLCARASRCGYGSARSYSDSFHSSSVEEPGRELHITGLHFSTIRFGPQIWILRYNALDNYARFLAFILFLCARSKLGTLKSLGEPLGQTLGHLSTGEVLGGLILYIWLWEFCHWSLIYCLFSRPKSQIYGTHFREAYAEGMNAPNIGRFMAPEVRPYAYRAFLVVSGVALLPFWAFSSDEWVGLDLWYRFEETNHSVWPALSARALPTGHRLRLVVVNQTFETWKRAFH